MSEFSVFLKEAIETSGYSIYSIAKEINYDRATLTNQINGKRTMNKDVFLKILNFLNLTETDKSKLIGLFHKDIFDSDFETFSIIKAGFENYSKASYSSPDINFSVPLNNNFKNHETANISGKASILCSINEIINCELKNEQPFIYFNFDPRNKELTSIIQSVYINNHTADIKSIVSFSTNKSDKTENFSKFISMLPLLLHGYCPYYFFSESNTLSEISILFPFYLITSEQLVLISSDFIRAIVISDKDVINTFKGEFIVKSGKCRQFRYESVKFYDIPDVFSACIDTQEKPQIYGINEKFCALPFLTKEHLYHMFSEKLNNHAEVIEKLLNCYKKTSGFISFVPVESIKEFVETGKDEHTNNEYSTPLTMKQRIEVLQTIKQFIINGGEYYFVRKSDFFCDELTFDIMSDSKVIFFNNDNISDKSSMSVLTLPNGLLSELKHFFRSLKRSCYVLSKEDAVSEIDKSINYAEGLLY